MFENYGKIVRITLVKGKTFAFVEFNTKAEAKSALALHGTLIKGKKLVVLYKNKRDRVNKNDNKGKEREPEHPHFDDLSEAIKYYNSLSS